MGNDNRLNDFEIRKIKHLLIVGQKKYVMSFPKRENIPEWDKKIRFEDNLDFSIWEYEITGV